MTPSELNSIYYNSKGELRSIQSLNELLKRANEQNKTEYIGLIQDEIKRRSEPGWERMPPHPFVD